MQSHAWKSRQCPPKTASLLPPPQIMGFEMSANKKYKYTGAITEKELGAFAKSVVDGTAEADYKSAAIPEEPLDEGVTTIVGKNFESIVMDPKKDVLLEVR